MKKGYAFLREIAEEQVSVMLFTNDFNSLLLRYGRIGEETQGAVLQYMEVTGPPDLAEEDLSGNCVRRSISAKNSQSVLSMYLEAAIVRSVFQESVPNMHLN